MSVDSPIIATSQTPSIRETDDDAYPALVNAFREEQQATKHGIADWQYVRGARSDAERQKLFAWRGQASLAEWVDVMQSARPLHCDMHLSQELLQESNSYYDRLFVALGKSFPVQDINMYNVVDFTICNLIPGVRSILDYGAGYGRQAFLFSRLPNATVYVTDAIETSYFSQYWTYRTLGFQLWEYFDQSSSLHTFLAQEGSKVVHLPTWQTDRIPDASLDVVLFVWSLSEMSEAAALHALNVCTKKLRVGGYIYLHDEPHTHGWKTEKRLITMGFLPVYQPWKLAENEIHGVPRLYRYVPNHLNTSNTQHCRLLLTAWRTKTFSLKQILVRARRMLPF